MKVFKTCLTCKKPKLVANDFFKDDRHHDGLYASCKECVRIVRKRSYRKHRDKRLQGTREWKRKNLSYVKNYTKEYRRKNRERVKAQMRDWRQKNAVHLSAYAKRYQARMRKQINKYVRTRSATDIQYRLERRLRTRLADALRGRQRFTSAIKDIGCTIIELRQHLQALWKSGMTWKNWGRGKGSWHIDHIIPLASFDLTQPEQQKAACHYTNLQPLWEPENLHKSGPRRTMSAKVFSWSTRTCP